MNKVITFLFIFIIGIVLGILSEILLFNYFEIGANPYTKYSIAFIWAVFIAVQRKSKT
jgi:hypothetical protein